MQYTIKKIVKCCWTVAENFDVLKPTARNGSCFSLFLAYFESAHDVESRC